MRVLSKILVATDFSPCAATALSQTVWLAKLVGAEVSATHVIPLSPEAMATFATNPWYVAANAEEIEERIRHGIDKRLEEAVSPHRSAAVTLHRKTLLELRSLKLFGPFRTTPTGTNWSPPPN